MKEKLYPGTSIAVKGPDLLTGKVVESYRVGKSRRYYVLLTGIHYSECILEWFAEKEIERLDAQPH